MINDHGHLIPLIIVQLAVYVADFLFWSILLSAIISMLLSFNVLDRRNRFIWSVADFFNRVSDPLLAPIRRRVPTFNGIDFSPWIALVFLQIVVLQLLGYLAYGFRTGLWPSLF